MHLFKLASDSEINRKYCPRVLGFVRRDFEKSGGEEEGSLIHDGLPSLFADMKSKLTEVKFIQLSQTPQCKRKPIMWWYWIKSSREDVVWPSQVWIQSSSKRERLPRKSGKHTQSGGRKDDVHTGRNGKAAKIFAVTHVLTLLYGPYIKIFMSPHVRRC